MIIYLGRNYHKRQIYNIICTIFLIQTNHHLAGLLNYLQKWVFLSCLQQLRCTEVKLLFVSVSVFIFEVMLKTVSNYNWSDNKYTE